MSIWRMSAGTSKQNPFTTRGRTYACASGGYVDVPDFDAEALVGQGWLVLAKNVVTTANRPVNALAGTRVFDSTVGAGVVSDGKGGWIHHATGASS